MSEQRSLFDPDERESARSGIALARAVLAGEATADDDAGSVAERERAIEQVARSSAHWRDTEALPFIRRYLEQHPTLFVDDLWRAGLPEPHDRKALGPALREAARLGWMRQTDQSRVSTGNSNRKPVWKSLLAEGTNEETNNE